MSDIHFYILSLSRRFDRTISGVSGMVAQGIPFEQIHVHLGRDGMDYETPMDMIDAMDKVYPELGKLHKRLHDDSDDLRWGRGDIGCLWSTLELLDAFIESEHEIGCYNQDDRCFLSSNLAEEGFYYKDRRAWPDLQLQVDALLDYDPKMKVFHNYHRSYGGEVLNPSDYSRITPELPITRGILRQGDSGIIFNKQGATELKELIFEHTNYIEHTITYEPDRPHYYSSLTPLRWTVDVDYRILFYGFVEGDINLPYHPHGTIHTAIQERVMQNYADFKAGHSSIASYELGPVEAYLAFLNKTKEYHQLP